MKSLRVFLLLMGLALVFGLVIIPYVTQPHYDKPIPATPTPVNQNPQENGTFGDTQYTIYNNWNGTGCKIIKEVYANGGGVQYGHGCTNEIVNKFTKSNDVYSLNDWNPDVIPSPIYCSVETCGTPKGYDVNQDQQVIDKLNTIIQQLNTTNSLLMQKLQENKT